MYAVGQTRLLETVTVLMYKLEYLAVYGRASIHGTRSESRESLRQSQAE